MNKDSVSPELLKLVDGSPVIAQLLYDRGYSQLDKASAFLDWRLYCPVSPGTLPGLKEAATIIKNGVRDGLFFCIYGDYDVDGVTSIALLKEVLEGLGARVSYHAPDRFREGYGLNTGVIEKLAAEGVNLIITCDCGIANHEEIMRASELGLKVVITDHHELPEKLPPAEAIVNPKILPEDHPARMLPGVGVVYYLAAYLLGDWPLELLDLVSLGIVADAVPLKADNRYWLQRGLSILWQTERPGLTALMEVAGIDREWAQEEEISFQLAPRLNAAGRMAGAGLAVELLLAKDVGQARELVFRLDRLNEERKTLCDQIYQEAENEVAQEAPVFVLYKPEWHEGVIGIVAGRLAEIYRRPVFMLTDKEYEPVVTGSARSGGVGSVYEMLSQVSSLLLRFGGHEAAAGLSLLPENIEEFKGTLVKTVTTVTSPEVSKVDYELEPQHINGNFYQQLRRLAPFGQENPVPVFSTQEMHILSVRSTIKHRCRRLVLGKGNFVFPGIWWRAPEGVLPQGKAVTAVYELSINRWQGKKTLQLVMREIIKSGDTLKTVPFRCRWVDMRGVKKSELMCSQQAVCYYEGVDKFAYITYNRYDLKQSVTLVMLSIPPHPSVFKEIILLTNPEELVLAWSRVHEEGNFLPNLLGLIKYTVNYKGGKTSIWELAAATGEMESTVYYGLKTLEVRGLIKVDIRDDDYVTVCRGGGESGTDTSERYLCKLLAESRSFRRFCAQRDLVEIKEIIG